jgi:dienelactone hydrolase
MKIFPLFSAALLLSAVAARGSADPLPLNAFARLPAYDKITISPDGRYLAMIRPDEGMRMAYVIDLKENAPVKRVMGGVRAGGFVMTWCRWANDTRLLCAYRAMKPDGKAIYPTTRLAAVNADGSEFMFLVQNNDELTFSQLHDRVIDVTPQDPKTILVELDADRDGLPTVFEIDIYSGKFTEVVHEHPPLRQFISDGQGAVRLGYGAQAAELSYKARLAGSNEWMLLSEFKAFDPKAPLRPLAVNAGNKMFARGNDQGRQALWELDLANRGSPILLFSHPQVDIGAALTTAAGRLLGVRYDTDLPFAYYVDNTAQQVVDFVKGALPTGSFNTVVDVSRDQQQYIIASTSDTDAGTYYLLNRGTGKVMRIGSAYPELMAAKDQLARTQPIRYAAGDGTEIPGYLTVPAGQRAENLPLVVMPHDGPIARATWSFDWLAQFMANGGYAVLQMNYRGSAGYGDAWYRAAHQDWGGLSYSDIADGARWAIKQGIADAKRVCIVGRGFGGYAALLGAARNADLFKCAASIGGMADLNRLHEDMRDLGDRQRDEHTYLDEQLVREQLGRDNGKLKANSPLSQAQAVTIPVLLVHGQVDGQVRVEHSRAMAGALKRAKRAHKLVEIEGADDELNRESDRVTVLTELEAFLKSSLSAAGST